MCPPLSISHSASSLSFIHFLSFSFRSCEHVQLGGWPFLWCFNPQLQFFFKECINAALFYIYLSIVFRFYFTIRNLHFILAKNVLYIIFNKAVLNIGSMV